MSCTQLIGNPIQSYQWPGLLTSGTGNPACAPLPCFSVIDSRGTAYNCRAFLLAESWLAAAQPGMAVPQRTNGTASGRGNPGCASLPCFCFIDCTLIACKFGSFRRSSCSAAA